MEQPVTILDDIIAYLAYNGQINYGKYREVFGDRVDKLRAALMEDVEAAKTITQQPQVSTVAPKLLESTQCA